MIKDREPSSENEFMAMVKSEARWKRKCERTRQKLIEALDKNDRLKHELKRTEDALISSYKLAGKEDYTGIRNVVRRVIPRAVKRYEDAQKD